MPNLQKEPQIIQSHRENYLPAIRFFTKRASSSILLARFSRFVNKSLYHLGIGCGLNRYANCFSLYSSHADQKLYKNYPMGSIFCNFGSGAFFHNKWKNYDYPGQSKYYQAIQGKEGDDFIGIDLCAGDLSIPEKDKSVSLIYCSHTLEHLEEAASRKFIGECLRILKPNGVMRVALPNTSSAFEMLGLIERQSNISSDTKQALRLAAAVQVLNDTKSDLTNDKIEELIVNSKYSAKNFFSTAVSEGVSNKFIGSNPERHICFWDYEELLSVSLELGFKFCMPFYQGSSIAKPFTNLNVFDNSEPHISFYAEFVK